MSSADSQIQELLRRASEGSRDALGQLLEQHRPWLRVLAKRYLMQQGNARFDDSDVIQQTCISVQRNFSRFRGTQIGEFIAWLREIHEKNLRNAVRDHFVTQKRAAGREVAPGADGHPEADLATQMESSPSQRAMRGERAVALASALEKLPENQREAIRLRYLEGLSLADIASSMDRSHDAVVGYIKRGLENLRRYLPRE